MHYVDLIESCACPERRYVGSTLDLKTRIKTHNAGGSAHTAKYTPWSLVCFIAFSDIRKAKSSSTYSKLAPGALLHKNDCGTDQAPSLRTVDVCHPCTAAFRPLRYAIAALQAATNVLAVM